MKKFFVFAALAFIALAGCTKDDPAPQVQQAIKFSSPVVGLNTKGATEIGEIYPTSNQFAVWGFYFPDKYTNIAEGELYINNATAYYEGGTNNTWYPRTKSTEGNPQGYYYWPKNGYLTFIAYSPAALPQGAEVSVNDILGTTDPAPRTGYISIKNYTVSTTPSEQQDLMFSERAYDMTSSSQGSLTGNESPYSGVDLQFRRALSSIVFNAKTKSDYVGIYVQLQSITLSGVAAKGDFKQNLDDESGAITNLYVPDDNNNNNSNKSANQPVWTVDEESKTVYAVANAASNNLTTVAYWPSTKSTVAPADYADNYSRSTDFLLIPQQIDDITLTVKYQIKSNDSNNWITQTYETTLSATDEAEYWKMGFRYIYNLVFSFDPITLAPTVAVYVDATSSDQQVDYYYPESGNGTGSDNGQSNN